MQKKHQLKWLVTHIIFSDELDVLYYYFISRRDISGGDGSYWSEVVLGSASWRIESNSGTQFIQEEEVVPGKPVYQNSHKGVFGVMWLIQNIDSIMGSTSLVVYSCDNIRNLIQALIHPESVTSQRKQVDIIYRLSGVYHAIDSCILLVHVYGHQNSRSSASTLTTLEYLNIWLDTLWVYTVESFLRSPSPRISLEVGL